MKTIKVKHGEIFKVIIDTGTWSIPKYPDNRFIKYLSVDLIGVIGSRNKEEQVVAVTKINEHLGEFDIILGKND